jgi:methionine-rich copper-binding protein CopC
MRLARLTALATVVLAAPAILTATSRFHLKLDKSEPADKSTIAQAPAELKLWFSAKVDLKLTKVALKHGTDSVALGALTTTDSAKAPLVAKVLKPVPPGAYTVEWRTMGADGHVVKGTFGFTLQQRANTPAPR